MGRAGGHLSAITGDERTDGPAGPAAETRGRRDGPP